jgi:hypothetical protein
MTDAELTAAAIAAVEAELGRTLTETETTQATQRVKNALVVIRVRHGADLSALDQDALVIVLAEVLHGRIESTVPAGVTEDSETIDDYTYRRRFSQASSRVTLLDEWWALLTPRRRGRAYSVMPS